MQIDPYSFQKIFFYFLSSLTVLASLFVVFSKNPVRSVIFLILAFAFMAGNWILLGAEFLGIVLVLVYVGAVMVLFLFVVMMLDLSKTQLASEKSWVKNWPQALLVFMGMLIIMALAAKSDYFSSNNYTQISSLAIDYSHVTKVGKLLFSDFLLPFELAGVILLVAMLASIGLTFRGSRTKKAQSPSEQVQVKKADRLKIIKM